MIIEDWRIDYNANNRPTPLTASSRAPSSFHN